jgi:hypothetical protein
VIVIQLALLVAVQLHADVVVTMACEVPPAVAEVAVSGDTVNEQVPF